MPGLAKRMIDSIIQQRTQGNPTLVLTTKTRITLKGVNPDKFTDTTEDSPEVIEKIRQIAKELGVVV